MLIDTPDISSVIQLAVAPVFLLAGIGGALSVTSVRLGRIVDRGRQLDAQVASSKDIEIESIRNEAEILRKRARLTNWSITLCTTSALFICLVIASLFVGAIFRIDVTVFIAFLFLVSITSLSAAFIIFLKEIELSTNTFKFCQLLDSSTDIHTRIKPESTVDTVQDFKKASI